MGFTSMKLSYFEALNTLAAVKNGRYPEQMK